MESTQMMEYHQYTLDEWMEIKEDLHRRLEELSSNFVGIGYRLRQIRDSQMYDGYDDIFTFANAEYGLSKSTVSRFIAINERFSEGGNSLELKEEYQKLSSSKLSEMLSLSDEECALITEKTTIADIRKYKEFKAEEKNFTEISQNSIPQAAVQPVPELRIDDFDDFEKCLWHYFGQPEKREALEILIKLPSDATAKEICNIVNPSGCHTYRHGIVYCFFYAENDGVKYKTMINPAITQVSWPEFLSVVKGMYFPVAEYDNVWTMCYAVPEKTPEIDGIDEEASKELEKAADEILENSINPMAEADSAMGEMQETSDFEPSENSENAINPMTEAVATSQQIEEIKAKMSHQIKMLEVYKDSENWQQFEVVARDLVKEAMALK